jgi:zinc protease
MKRLAAILLASWTLLFGLEGQLSVPFTQFKLDNGLQVILHEDHSLPIVSVNILYHVGSAREKPGRTGFAHLFEHLLFQESGHVPKGMFEEWLEAVGGTNNGGTGFDNTVYWEDIPTNALELALFLESDRMGYLLDVVSPDMVDLQRDVVLNERRQRYENRPYGMAYFTLFEQLHPVNHPYHWMPIGYPEDLIAASHEDVIEFYKKYYGTNNASLVVAGDINPEETKDLVTHWFSDVPEGSSVQPLEISEAYLCEEKRPILEDQVQLPRLYMAWVTPAAFQPGDAEMAILASILSGGKNSRLYKRLVYELQIAQDVSTSQNSLKESSVFVIVATARSGRTLDELETVILEELDRVKTEPPTEWEVQRTVNQYEASFLRSLERVGGFSGKADQLNNYYFYTGQPDYFDEDLARYKAVTPEAVTEVMNTYLRNNCRVILSIVPTGQTELAAHGPDATTTNEEEK